MPENNRETIASEISLGRQNDAQRLTKDAKREPNGAQRGSRRLQDASSKPPGIIMVAFLDEFGIIVKWIVE